MSQNAILQNSSNPNNTNKQFTLQCNGINIEVKEFAYFLEFYRHVENRSLLTIYSSLQKDPIYLEPSIDITYFNLLFCNPGTYSIRDYLSKTVPSYFKNKKETELIKIIRVAKSRFLNSIEIKSDSACSKIIRNHFQLSIGLYRLNSSYKIELMKLPHVYFNLIKTE